MLARASELRFRIGARSVRLKTPNPVDFVLMKLDAMRIRYPKKSKDAFDLYAYVRKKTPAVVAAALVAAREREEALQRLHEVFADENAVGVVDVLTFAGSLQGMDRALVARDVVRTFAEVSPDRSCCGWSSAPISTIIMMMMMMKMCASP